MGADLLKVKLVRGRSNKNKCVKTRKMFAGWCSKGELNFH